jgi:AcrR family transcriptional regulator
MGRPAIIDDEKVLDAAREVFLAKGVNATTSEVAKRAGISQASIFKRFKSKQRLFLSALHAERVRQDWIGVFERRTAEVGVREALVELGLRAISFAGQILPLVLVSWSNRAEFGPPPGFEKGPYSPFSGVERMVAVLGREMKAGRLRKHEPWLVARAVIGAVQSYALMSVVLKRPLGPPLEPEAYVRGVVDVVWDGIGPRRGGAS